MLANIIIMSIQLTVNNFFRELIYHRARLNEYYLITITGDAVVIYNSTITEILNVADSYEYENVMEEEELSEESFEKNDHEYDSYEEY